MLSKLYDEVRGELASVGDYNLMLDWVRSKGVVLPEGSCDEESIDLFRNIVELWNDLQVRGDRLLLDVRKAGECSNLTEAQYIKALAKGEVLRAAPDAASRIKFVYSNGVETGYIHKQDGSIKVYRSEAHCWRTISDMESIR